MQTRELEKGCAAETAGHAPKNKNGSQGLPQIEITPAKRIMGARRSGQAENTDAPKVDGNLPYGDGNGPWFALRTGVVILAACKVAVGSPKPDGVN